MSNGLIHLYHGDGKGKTTAAMGLAVRALGCGRRVVIVQFLKGGATGELEPLQTLGATFYRGKAGQKFVFQMNEEEKAATRALQTENLRRALLVHFDALCIFRPKLEQKSVLKFTKMRTEFSIASFWLRRYNEINKAIALRRLAMQCGNYGKEKTV